MTEQTLIPLNKLVRHAGNVRKAQNKAFIKRLAANIQVHGLHQNLLVIPQGKRFAVAGGGQRLSALQLLAKHGRIKPTHPVPCKVVKGGLDARELSLAENIMREDMHPADVFEAVRGLVDDGVPMADIAARFKLSESYLRQLLKLARVSPAIVAAYRAGKLNLEQVMAFAVTDEHEAQEALLERLETLRPHQREAHAIRAALTEHEIPATDRRVKCVTLEAYRKQGGGIREDLFTDGDEGVFILDAALLERLVAEKLDRAAKRVSKEGWKWVEIYADFGYEHRGQFRRVHAEPAPLPEDLAAEYAALEQERDTLQEAWYETEDETEEPPRIAEIEERLEAIDAARGDDVWTPEQLAIAGAVVTIGHDGKPAIERGLVRPEDMPKAAKPAKPATEGAAGEVPAPVGISASLAESLTAHRSAALAAALRQRPAVALAAVVHAMAVRVFRLGASETAVQLTVSPQPLRAVEGSKAFSDLEDARAAWEKKLPATADALWAWCLAQPQEELMGLLAFCAASSVNAVQAKNDRPQNSRLENANALAAALDLDMTPWFTPDAQNYYSRVSKPQILDALREGRNQPPAPAWEKMKKGELATLAERELKDSGWLPEILRPAA
jgi:ParB family chromosome partitioning protein